MSTSPRNTHFLGTKLRALRKRNGLTLEELSARWSVPKATLYNWVNQRRLPYVKLGRSLRFSVDELEKLLERSTIGVAGKR